MGSLSYPVYAGTGSVKPKASFRDFNIKRRSKVFSLVDRLGLSALVSMYSNIYIVIRIGHNCVYQTFFIGAIV